MLCLEIKTSSNFSTLQFTPVMTVTEEISGSKIGGDQLSKDRHSNILMVPTLQKLSSSKQKGQTWVLTEIRSQLPA